LAEQRKLHHTRGGGVKSQADKCR